ncbi:ATP-dependent DNA ligase LigC [Caenispirillum salinarum AK4]|uniref:DNA ligase (ATP) n=1 Tax=Caenispirillum salinarum AK4 TaxID=1238182 RepID=K9HHY8_9PROT|nr:cisplatin damage response ATP-dependent DNA ligase [Caenispirillum salinarum]EKV28226.1 ATP-dependent DNA ligase LigC [Caenispirillum salinarum AK4]
MQRFADLLDGLVTMPSRNGKLRLIEDYLAHAPDPDRGYGLAALTGELDLGTAKPKAIRELAEARCDPVLFYLSYDYVGDLAETLALMWQGPEDTPEDPPPLWEVIDTLMAAPRTRIPELLAGWLDRLDATGRWALLKLITSGLRVGVSGRLARTAFAGWAGLPLNDVEEAWPCVQPPYEPLFAWAAGGPKPEVRDMPAFRPFMLANPLEETDMPALDPADYAVEWKWDGIRVQVARRFGETRIFARSGDDITHAFPDVVEAADFDGALDGELLVMDASGEPAPFNHLQQRLNRKTVSAAMLRKYPAFVRAYDLLQDGPEDLREHPFRHRRKRLEALFGTPRDRFDLSPLIPLNDWSRMAELRDEARARGMEGLMLKRWDSVYVPGRPKGPWFKWKRDPLTVDAVLLYAQRGHGKRSSFYSDYTFGVWRDDELVPVGKAYFGFTDEELRQIDRWVRANTTDRFGPVRAVTPGLVFEVAFDSVHPSPRHKSGLAMRFPRISRIRWDKPHAEADRLETLLKLVEAAPAADGG